MDFKHWLAGAIAAIINGAASAVVLIILDPKDFNIYDGWRNLLLASGAHALFGVASFLKQSPLPSDWLNTPPDGA